MKTIDWDSIVFMICGVPVKGVKLLPYNGIHYSYNIKLSEEDVKKIKDLHPDTQEPLDEE